MVIDGQLYQTGNKQQNIIRHCLHVSLTSRVCITANREGHHYYRYRSI